MEVLRTVFTQEHDVGTATSVEVNRVSDLLLSHLNKKPVLEQIALANVPKASSGLVQDAFLDYARFLGFTSEAKGLFVGLATPNLRPDYFLAVGESGILLEVERGKTTINNMDLLDLWKCHVCAHADYLFLLVPTLLVQGDRRPTRPYNAVIKRMSTFFTPATYANVKAVHIFGY